MQGPARAGRDLDLETALVWDWAVAGLAMHERRSGCLAGFDAATSCLIGLHAEFVCEERDCAALQDTLRVAVCMRDRRDFVEGCGMLLRCFPFCSCLRSLCLVAYRPRCGYRAL